jgi:hypothetical protein
LALQAAGVPRTDPGAEGIHLLWTWPDVLPVSIGGYDIQRLPMGEEQLTVECEDIDRQVIDALQQRGEYAAPLGPLTLRKGSFQAIADPSLYPPGGTAVLTEAESTHLTDRLQALLAASAIRPSATVTEDYDVFIQELTTPTQQASVMINAKLAVAMALSQGKVTGVVPATTMPASLNLDAPRIDTIIVYAIEPLSIRICEYFRPSDLRGGPDPVWDKAPYLVKGLTLPIQEADPTLTTPDLEYAKAKERLLAGETLTQANFAKMAQTLRKPVKDETLGRSGERIVLVRSDTTQTFEELPLDTQLGGLTIHPKIRRVLGYGYHDNHGLAPGQTYRYRITGRFQAEDRTDIIYDVHRVPSGTMLPPAFSIRDLGLRFQVPVQVILDPAPQAAALNDASRRGIRVDTTGYDSSWLIESFGGWSAIIDFPFPVTSVVLEVSKDHAFKYAGLDPWITALLVPAPLPPGPTVPLTFAQPVTELRLEGTGTLFAVRIPSGQRGVQEVHAYTGRVTYAPEPLPQPPPVFTAYNLQQPPAVLTGPIDESTPIPPRPPAGFRLNWLPPVTGGLAAWPPDLDAGPPLDALAYRIQHRVAVPPGQWEPISGDDNLTIGSRDDSPPAVQLGYGCDLDAVFPQRRPRAPGAGYALHLSDVFGQLDPVTGTILRPDQPFGSYHQYAIDSMDAVGRVSALNTLSNVVRLEKHYPPPLPAGPQPETPPVNGKLTNPPGPGARAIIAGDPGLTPADEALLGAHQNAILLEWGWRQAERDLDPTTAEFRVYSTVPPDIIDGTITSVVSAGPDWQVTMTTSLPLVANELAGLWISSNGYPFKVIQNDAGSTPSILLAMSLVQPSAQPVPGPVTFGRPLAPAHQSPASWDQRVAVYPQTAADSYQHVFYDVLNLSAAHPRDAIWVGVSAADAQDYVPDQRTVGPNANRPGNESAIVACGITAVFRGRPVFGVPPPLGDVPELITAEPAGRAVLVTLDLAALVPGGALPAGVPCVLERCSAEDILSRTSVVNGQVVVTHPDGTQDVIAFPNPGDDAAVLAALNGPNPQTLANRYLVHLVVASSDPAAFFTRLAGGIVTAGPVDDRLAPQPARYMYLVRAADAAGHVSAGIAILPLIVRVPATVLAAKPERRTLTATATSATLTVAVPGPARDTTAVLLFALVAPPGADPPPQFDAEILRLPNRPDLYASGNALRLLLSDGTVLPPAVVKSLADADVTVEADGTRVAVLTVPAATGSWVTLWCFGLTVDGFPSYRSGPFGTAVRA